VGDALVLELMRYERELVDVRELRIPEVKDLRPQELKMAEQLVASMTGDFSADEYQDDYRQALMAVIERKVAGVMLMTSELDATLIAELARREVSVVFLDLGEPGPHMSNLRVNYEAGIDEAIRHLVSLGHRRVSFVCGPEHLRSAARRLDAFRASMKKYLPDSRASICEGDFKIEGGALAARKILSGGRGPTAVVCANDLMALGAMNEFRAAGVRVPRDISIVGYDDIAFAALSEPKLTTVCLPRAELGRRAVEALVATLAHPDQQGAEVNIMTHLVVRDSTAPAPEGADF